MIEKHTAPVLLVDPSGWVPKHTDKLGTLGSQIVELALGNDCIRILTWDESENELMYIPDDPRQEYTKADLDKMFGNTLEATDLLTLHYDIFWRNRVTTHRITEVRFFNGRIECNMDLYCVNHKHSGHAYSLYCLTYGADTAGCEYCYFTT
jgi:hypothetical protein